MSGALPVSFCTPGGDPLPVDGDFRAVRLSWRAVGGPESAELALKGGGPAALAELPRLLGCAVELRAASGRRVWWGQVTGLEARQGAARASVSLEGMANRAAVTYSRVEAGGTGAGERATTPWAGDLASQAQYGLFERVFPLDGATDEAALAHRDVLLAQYGKPLSRFSVGTGGSEGDYLRVTCAGWWQSLGQVRYAQAAGQAGWRVAGAGVQPVGAPGSLMVAQRFTAEAGWRAEWASVRVRSEGTSGDNLTLALHADTGASPGERIASASLPAAGLSPAELLWEQGSFALPPALEAGRAYWLVVSRSGPADASNHYRVDVDEGCGFAGGSARVWDGAAWAGRAPAASLLFTLGGAMQTTVQAALMAQAAGSRLNGVLVEAPSGVFTSPYRAGERSVRAELEGVLALGTSTGARLLAEVTESRGLRLYTPPGPLERGWRLDAAGSLWDEAGAPVEAGMSPAGRWVRLKEAPAAFAAPLADPCRAFIERAEWDAAAGSWRLG